MLQRNIEESVRRAMSDTPVVLLNGARQTGKTTLVQAMAQKVGAHYFTLDDSATLALAAGDPVGFIRNLSAPAAIDEIQKVPALFPAIKLAVDSDRRPGRFLLTGSANIMTLPRLSESLAGRMEIIPLFPLSGGELAGRRGGFSGAPVRLPIRRSKARERKRWRCRSIGSRRISGRPCSAGRTNAARRGSPLTFHHPAARRARPGPGGVAAGVAQFAQAARGAHLRLAEPSRRGTRRRLAAYNVDPLPSAAGNGVPGSSTAGLVT